MAIIGGSVQLMRKDCLGNTKFPPVLECERIVGWLLFFGFWGFLNSFMLKFVALILAMLMNFFGGRVCV